MAMRTPAILLLAFSAALADDKDDLARAARRLAEAGSYTFKVEIRSDAPFPIPGLEGRHGKDAGTHVKAGDRVELFHAGGKLFVRQGEGDWAPADGHSPAGGRRRRGGGMLLHGMAAPHEELKGLESALREIKKGEPEKVGEKTCIVLSGELTKEGIAASPLGRSMSQFGPPGGAAGFELSGTARAWIDADGNLLRYEMRTRVAGEFGGNAFEFSLLRTTDFSEVGRTRVEVPEGVRKLLEERALKPEDQR